VHPPIVLPIMMPRSDLEEGAGGGGDVSVLVALATLAADSLITELLNTPQLLTAALVNACVAQPCCVMVVRLYAMSHL
jgi:hypothetical protein